MVQFVVKLKNGDPYFGGTIYGLRRDEHNDLVGMPDFLDDACQT
jgi:hypothetical protein